MWLIEPGVGVCVQGQTAKTTLLQSGGVSDYKFSTASTNGGLQAVYGQAPPAGCQLAVCAHYPNQVCCSPVSHSSSRCLSGHSQAAASLVQPVVIP